MAITQGPWTFNRSRGQVDCNGGTICHNIGWSENGQAISAVPEMYEVLRAVLPLLNLMADTTKGEPAFNDGVKRVLEGARAAVAKAEGK